MFDFWSVYSGERFRASWPSCLLELKALLLYILLMKENIFKCCFLYMVHFGCHGNVNFESNIHIFFFGSIVRSDMDYFEFA